MNTQEQIETLKDIRKMMNRSVRFLSLSGFAGIFAGLYALIAGFTAYWYMDKSIFFNSYTSDDKYFFILLAACTLVLAITTAFIFTNRKVRKQGLSLWNETTKVALINFSIPLFAGGVLCLALIYNEMFALLAPATLIFYGLSLISVSKHTFEHIKILGVFQITLGLINAFFLGYGLIFWIIGFGILHIIYGVFMYLKYDRT